MQNPFGGFQQPTGRLTPFDQPDIRQSPFLRMLGLGRQPEEIQLERQTQAKGGLVGKVGELTKQGLPPNKIMIQLMNDPEFVEAFSRAGSAGDVQKLVTDLVQSAQAPKPESFTLAPGQGRFTMGPDGQARQVAGMEPSEVQTFQRLTAIAKLNPEELKVFARAQLEGGQGGEGSTAAERVVARMVARGEISRTEGDTLLMEMLQPRGNIRIVQPRNEFGQPIGNPVVMDITSGQTVAAGGQPQQQPQPQVTPQATPQSGADVVEGQPEAGGALTGLEDPTDMFVFTGPFALGRGALETAGGMLDPLLTTGKVRAGRNALRNLRANIQGLSVGTRRLTIDTKVLDDILPSLGVWENPSEALQTGSQLIDTLTNLKTIVQQVSKDPQRSKEARIEADQQISNIDRVLKSMPTKAQISTRLNAIKKGEGGAVTPSGLIEQGRKAISGGDRSQAILKMSADELDALDEKRLSPKEFEAVFRRIEQLKNEANRSR